MPPSVSEPATSLRSPAFRRLARPVREWIWRKGWKSLRDIQERAIPEILDGDRDVVLAAPTASGKTEAAFVPLLSGLVSSNGSKKPGFDILYVSPLKALINDQHRRLEELCDSLDVPVHKWHGDVAAVYKERAEASPAGILLITPEALEAMFVRRGTRIPQLFGGTRCVVVDELHTMLDTERGIQLRSLMSRMEIAVRRHVRRIGLSATLGDMNLAAKCLRPGSNGTVTIIRSEVSGQLVKLLVKGYRVGVVPKAAPEAAEESQEEAAAGRPSSGRSIASHIFQRLRGRQNLVFADSRQAVELYADRLRGLANRNRLPNEFHAHHANLARQHREFVEKRLRSASQPTTAVCTSTLELGIDIGDVESIAQIGPPYSVSSTRQRLGRSGRRMAKAAVLRTYIQESEIGPGSHPADELRFRLVRSIAIIDLLLQGWCEPPEHGALHLSTLVQQILSVIAERGGASARVLFDILCRKGAFAAVDAQRFKEVLVSIGRGDSPLIEQMRDGTLLLSGAGERIVEHYTFYAAFGTPEEYRVVAAGKVLGTLPVDFAVVVGSAIIFAGKRWRVTAVDVLTKVIDVAPDPSGQPPKFSGSPGLLHDAVAQSMRAVYESEEVPPYLDATAKELLAEARSNYRFRGLHRTSVVGLTARQSVVFPWRGTVMTETLALALTALGLKASPHDHLVVEVRSGAVTVRRALRILASRPAPRATDLAKLMRNLEREKYHRHLSPALQCVDAASARIRANAIPPLAAELLSLSGSRRKRSMGAHRGARGQGTATGGS